MDEPEVTPDNFIEGEISFKDRDDAGVETLIPECLWCDGTPDEKPLEPDKAIDQCAADVELKRLMMLGVIREAEVADDAIQRTLATRFVFDWRWKPYGKFDDGREQFRCLRHVASSKACCPRIRFC